MQKHVYITLRILKLLSQEPYITSRMVADDMQLSVRSAQRYLDEISCRSFVHTEKIGTQIRYFLLKNEFYIENSILNDVEISFINMLLNLGVDELKMDGSFIDQLKSKIFYMSTIPYSAVTRYDKVDFARLTRQRLEIEKAIKKKKVISFVYTRYSNPQEFTAHPYRMIFYNGFLMLLCLHDQILKKFAVDFMENIQIDRKIAYIPKNEEEIKILLSNVRSMWFQNSTSPVTVQVKFFKMLTKLLEMKECFPNQRIISKDDTGCLVEFDAHNEQDCWDMLKVYIPNFIIISPEPYRDFICNQIGIFVNNHPNLS